MFDAFDDDFGISLVESTLDPHLEETLPLQVYAGVYGLLS